MSLLGRLEDSRWSEISSSPEVKRDDLAYFALSVFWRAAIHRWPDPEDPTRTIKIELGPSNTELLRRFLLGEAALPPTVRRDRSLSDPNTMRFGELIAEDLDDGKSVKRLSVTANSECLMAIISSIYVRHFQVFSR